MGQGLARRNSQPSLGASTYCSMMGGLLNLSRAIPRNAPKTAENTLRSGDSEAALFEIDWVERPGRGCIGREVNRRRGSSKGQSSDGNSRNPKNPARR